MKQFFLKNIVLVVVIVITLIAAAYLSLMILQKRAGMDRDVAEIVTMSETVQGINSAHNPNNVADSEKLINEDIDFLDGVTNGVYRHFGNPYRTALLGFCSNIVSKTALTPVSKDSQKDPAFTVQKEEKKDADEDAEEATDESGDEEKSEDSEKSEDAEDAEETEKEAPAGPDEEELAIFNPQEKRVVINVSEEKMRELLGEAYKELHVDVQSDSDDFVIPDNVLEERYAVFAKFIQKLIAPPEVIGAARAEAYKQAAVEKVAIAFDIFKDEVSKLTLENVDNNVAKQMFMDALGIPRLVRRLECKNYLDNMYSLYHDKNCIPGFKQALGQGKAAEKDIDGNVIEDEDAYTENLNAFVYSRQPRQAPPVADMVIPIFRNFQIKEDLIRRMNETKIRKVIAVTPKFLPGATTDGDPDGAILVYTYTIEVQSSVDEIARFIESMHAAYKDNRVYVLTNLKFEVLNNDINDANAIVEEHIRLKKIEDGELPDGYGAGENRNIRGGAQNGKNANDPDAKLISIYKPDDPKHEDYGRVLIGGNRGEINCTLTVDYYLYRGDNIIPDK